MGSSEILLPCSLRLWRPSLRAQTCESPLFVDMGALIYIMICNIPGIVVGLEFIVCPQNHMHIS